MRGIIRTVVNATRLQSRHQSVLISFLKRDVVCNLFSIGVLERWGMAWVTSSEWWGVFDDAESLKAVVYAGNRSADGRFGLAVASGAPDAAELLGLALAERGGVAWAVGETDATEALWRGLGGHTARVCSDQVLMETSTVGDGEHLALRRATSSDFDWVSSAASSMMREDLGVDIAADSPTQFLSSIHSCIANGQEFIGCHDGARVFRARVGTDCSGGAQIGGVWVEPSQRGSGFGEAGTRALVRELLSRVPRVTLHVRQENKVAIRCYTAAGFVPVRAFRLLVR
jgi:ribosomal protein S18 acetylase RimI-like enzyme